MELYLNGELISFELEEEKNCYEIVLAIGEYCSNHEPQQFLTNIFIDGVEYSFADENGLKNIALDKINKIEFETKGVFGISLLSIEQIEKYLQLLKAIINNQKHEESFEKIKDSMSWMKEGVNQIVNIFSNKKNELSKEREVFIEEYEKLYSIIKVINPKKFEISVENARLCNLSLEIMQKKLKIIRQWLNESFDFLDKDRILNNINIVLKDIEDIIPRLSNIPLLFQTGEDVEAMNVVQKLATILEQSINIFVVFKENSRLHLDKFTVKEVSFEVFFETLTDHLRDLMSAIENKDSIMMGDLLEYEFIPNVEEIKNILTKIREEAFIKAN